MLRIIADVPSSNPGLGFREYAEAIADAIRGGEPPQFTIGLYGPWGSGKSSLLNAIMNSLRKDEGKIIPVLFDAWRYERTQHVIVPILYSISEEIHKKNDKSLFENFKRALLSVVKSLTFNIEALGIEFTSKEVIENWESRGLPLLDQAFSKPYEEMRQIPRLLKDRRIVVLIDDLDRCSPEKVVSVLESINLVMDIPGLIFVLALDYEVLIQAINIKYPHVSGDSFIQKMVQLPFRVPRLDLSGSDFFAELIPNWSEWYNNLPEDSKTYLLDVSILALEANPRQIKRLINSFLLLHRVVTIRGININFELMAGLIGVQLRWPAQYRDLLYAVLSDDSKPLNVLSTDKNEPQLKTYAERFFRKSYTLADLRQILQLTTVVAAEEETADVFLPANKIRETNRNEFIIELEKRGFKKSDRSNRLFYNINLPNIRFAITKHVARFEKKKKNTWTLWESYLLTRETEFALKVIENPEIHYTNRM